MMKTSTNLSWSQVLLDGISFGRKHWSQILTYAVLALAIWLVYWFAFFSTFDLSFRQGDSLNSLTPLSAIFFIIGIALLIALYAGSFLFIDGLNNQQPLRPWNAVIQVLPRLGHFIAILLLLEVSSWIGLLLLVLPGIYIYARLIISDYLVVLSEKKGPIEALAASWRATSGNVLSLFILVVIGLVVSCLLLAWWCAAPMIDSYRSVFTGNWNLLGESLTHMIALIVENPVFATIYWALLFIWTVIRYQIYSQLRNRV